MTKTYSFNISKQVKMIITEPKVVANLFKFWKMTLPLETKIDENKSFIHCVNIKIINILNIHISDEIKLAC